MSRTNKLIPLASNTPESHLQDRSARMEVGPWGWSCMQELCVAVEDVRGRPCLIDLFSYRGWGQDINRTAKFSFCGPSIWN